MTPPADTLKPKVAEAVDRLADELETLSHRIHGHPELAFKEEQAHAWLTAFLEKHGAKVERGVGGLPTAFRATIEGAGPGPTVAIPGSASRRRARARARRSRRRSAASPSPAASR